MRASGVAVLMQAEGTTFRILTLRIAEVLDGGEHGSSLIRRYPIDITLAPVIEIGETYVDPGPLHMSFKGVDTFSHFEIMLRDRRLLRWDRRLRLMLRKWIAIEFWTLHRTDDSPDPEYPWIHWVFPMSSWKRTGRGIYEGKTMRAIKGYTADDLPAGIEPFEGAAFWKTATPPPL